MKVKCPIHEDINMHLIKQDILDYNMHLVKKDILDYKMHAIIKKELTFQCDYGCIFKTTIND